MNRQQFLRKLKKHCKDNNKSYDWSSLKGKGSHGTVYVEGKKTVVQDGELSNDYIGAVLKQLGLEKSAI